MSKSGKRIDPSVIPNISNFWSRSQPLTLLASGERIKPSTNTLPKPTGGSASKSSNLNRTGRPEQTTERDC